MGIDGMRVGGGRCPPLVAISILISFLLVCNWWNLSTENTELLSQIDQLHEELKISLEERGKVMETRNDFEKKFKHSEDEFGALNVRLQQQESEAKKEHDELSVTLDICKSELQSQKTLDIARTGTLEAMRIEKKLFNDTLDLKTEEIKKLQATLDKVKSELNNLTKTCNIRATQKAQDTAVADNISKEEGLSDNNGKEEGVDEQNTPVDDPDDQNQDKVVQRIMDKAKERSNKEAR